MTCNLDVSHIRSTPCFYSGVWGLCIHSCTQLLWLPQSKCCIANLQKERLAGGGGAESKGCQWWGWACSWGDNNRADKLKKKKRKKQHAVCLSLQGMPPDRQQMLILSGGGLEMLRCFFLFCFLFLFFSFLKLRYSLNAVKFSPFSVQFCEFSFVVRRLAGPGETSRFLVCHLPSRCQSNSRANSQIARATILTVQRASGNRQNVTSSRSSLHSSLMLSLIVSPSSQACSTSPH